MHCINIETLRIEDYTIKDNIILWELNYRNQKLIWNRSSKSTLSYKNSLYSISLSYRNPTHKIGSNSF